MVTVIRRVRGTGEFALLCQWWRQHNTATVLAARWANYDNIKKDAKKQPSSLENKDCLVLAQANNSIGNEDSAHKTSNNIGAATVMLTVVRGRVEITFPNIWRPRNVQAIERNCRGKPSSWQEAGP